MKAEAHGQHELPAELLAQLTSLQHQISLLPQIPQIEWGFDWGSERSSDRDICWNSVSSPSVNW